MMALLNTYAWHWNLLIHGMVLLLGYDRDVGAAIFQQPEFPSPDVQCRNISTKPKVMSSAERLEIASQIGLKIDSDERAD